MKPDRKIVLRREALTPLASDEMSRVVGGTHYCLPGVTDQVTHGASCQQACLPSDPFEDCMSGMHTCSSTCDFIYLPTG